MNRALVIVALCAACTSRAEPVAKVKLAAPGKAAPVGDAATPGLRLPDDIVPLAYDLKLELDPQSVSFHGEVTIRARVTRATDRLWIHAMGLAITSATVGGETMAPVDAKGDEIIGFRFARVMAVGEIALHFVYDGVVGANEEGLFREATPDGFLLVSQSESVFARHILPCFDEPRWKVPWRVAVVVPAETNALANAGEMSRTTVDGGRVQIVFAETPPMPSYLFAVAVGKFAIVDLGVVGAKKVPLRIALAHDDVKLAALARVVVPKLVAQLETYFASPLPWPKLDLVAVPKLFGAMENPGLVTFHRPILVGDAKNAHDVRELARIAGHELAHLWFGDWVTFAWWNDLWLAESFASWMGDKVAAAIGAFPDAAVDAALSRRRALAADAAVDARPLDRALVKSHDAEDAFDAIAYDKGQAVLAMFEQFAGAEKFRAAIRAYLGAHANGTATGADLVAAVARATTPALGAALASFVARPGAPTIALACEHGAVVARALGATSASSGVPGGSGAPAAMGASSSGGAGASSSGAGASSGGSSGGSGASAAMGASSGGSAIDVTVPACVRSPLGDRCVLVAPGAAVRVAESCPAWIAGNARGAGYYHLATSPLAPATATLAGAERIVRGDDIAAALARGDIAAPTAIAELHALAAGGDLEGRLGALAIAAALDAVVPAGDDPRRLRWATYLAGELASAVATNDRRGWVRSDRTLREGLAALGVAPVATKAPRAAIHAALATWVKTKRAVPLALVLADELVSAGPLPANDLAIARTAIASAVGEERELLLAAVAEAAPPELAGVVFALALQDPSTASALDAIESYLARGATRTAAWEALAAHLPAVLAMLGSDDTLDLVGALGAQCDARTRDAIARGFAAPEVARAVAKTLATIDRCIARAKTLGTSWP